MEPIKLERMSGKRGYGYSDPKEFHVSFVPHRSGTYKIEIDDIIENVSQFSTAIQVLEQAKEEDEVIVYLQTGGGSVGAGEAFIHALRKCAAPIHMVGTGCVASMGTCILLEADSFELSNGFYALVHGGSNGAYGAVNEYHAKSAFDASFGVAQFKESYEGMFSDSELDDILKGRDYWMSGPEWCERAEKRSAYFRAKYEAMTKPPRKPRAKKVSKAVASKVVDKAPQE